MDINRRSFLSFLWSIFTLLTGYVGKTAASEPKPKEVKRLAREMGENLKPGQLLSLPSDYTVECWPLRAFLGLPDGWVICKFFVDYGEMTKDFRTRQHFSGIVACLAKENYSGKESPVTIPVLPGFRCTFSSFAPKSRESRMFEFDIVHEEIRP